MAFLITYSFKSAFCTYFVNQMYLFHFTFYQVFSFCFPFLHKVNLIVTVSVSGIEISRTKSEVSNSLIQIFYVHKCKCHSKYVCSKTKSVEKNMPFMCPFYCLKTVNQVIVYTDYYFCRIVVRCIFTVCS